MSSPIDQFIHSACTRNVARANELLQNDPSFATANFFAACVSGEFEFVENSIRDNRELAVTPGGPKQWPPLLYACYSSFLRTDSPRAERLAQVARLLLDNGASPNSSYLWENTWPLSALYSAAGYNNHAGLTQLLLERGANPNDNESLYHSAEFKDHACTKLLLTHGAKIEGSNALHRKLDYDDLEGLRLFLDHGADANLRSNSGVPLAHWAISNGRRAEFLNLLAQRGADLRALSPEGLTPFRLASRLGHTEAVRYLTDKGFAEELSAKDTFIAACAGGDLDAAEVLLEQNPTALKSLEAADLGLLPNAAWRGKLDAVTVMIEAGFPVAATGKNGETALHCAAWMGHFAIIRVLIAEHAPLEVMETQYGATPLDWAIHGSVNSRDNDGQYLNPQADYPGIVRALLQAGAILHDRGNEDLPQAVAQIIREHRR